MDLAGQWRAAPASDELRRVFFADDLDEVGWVDVAVPGPWAAQAALASERAVLYRTHFDMEPPADGGRRWLTIHGLAQQGDIWLNGAYVGNTDGYFVPHRFEVTHLCQDRTSHLLAIDATVPSEGDPNERTHMMGALLDSALTGTQSLNPGGLRRTVTIEDSGASAILHFRAVCADANPRRARLALRCVFEHPDGGPITLRTNVAGIEHELEHVAAIGENRVEWNVDIDKPELWWPHSLGDQPLHELSCELQVDGETHDQRQVRTAFRKVQMRNWILSINGTRMFAKGVVMLPNVPRPGLTAADQAKGDVAAARHAGFDLVRLVAHVANPAVYQTADELGMLIWQEMPLRGLMSRSVRVQAKRQARELVDLLGHHPSVAVWCAHDEPFKSPTQPQVTPPVMGQQRPSWNRSVLDTSIRRVMQRTDGSRPVVNHTAVPPHLPNLDGTTSHLWFGWHGGDIRDMGEALASVPRMGRFVSAFGAATVDSSLAELARADWENLDWDELAAAIGAAPGALRHLVSPETASSGPRWASLTEQAQASVLRIAIETLRRLKYRPTGGFCAFSLADPTPAGGFGILTYDRKPKPAWDAVMKACRPVLVIADPLPPVIASPSRYQIAVHLVSSLQHALVDGEVTATITSPGGHEEVHRWGGSIGPDSVEHVATLSIKPEVRGELDVTFVVTATGPDGSISETSHYRSFVN